MSDGIKHIPTIHIKPQDQSAPKEHWADREIMKAAEEMDAGNYIPDSSDEAKLDTLGLALRTGSKKELQAKPSLQDFQDTRTLNEIGRHPRVIEALERLKHEAEEAKNPQEAIEKQWMLHELAAKQAAGQKWDGQERWEGKENEEMRIGQILAPYQFHEKLAKIIGLDRVLLSPHAVKTSPEARSGRVGLYVKNPRWQGEQPQVDWLGPKVEALKKSAQKEIDNAKRLRRIHLNHEADKGFERAAEMIQTATEMLMEESARMQLAEPELLRVGTLQWPCGTEWMVMNFDKYGVPTTAKYLGWRTALLTMVRCGAITEGEAHKAFPVGSGEAASWYLEQLMMLRNEAGIVQ